MSENHIGEEQLVLFYYGEADDRGAIDAHLAACEPCRAQYRGLQAVLNTLDSAHVPERGPDYGAAVWGRISKQVRFRRKFSWLPWWAWAPAAAALLVLAFLAGRVSQPPPAPTVASNQVRERILLVAVGDHLERSQMVLAEISNAPEGKGKIDISDERHEAEDLLDSNRLFRQTAATTGDHKVAGILDDLERVLLEITHSPSEIDPARLEELRQEINDRGLMFKIRVVGSQVEKEQAAPAPRQEKGSL